MIIAKTIAVSIAIFTCTSCDSGNGKRMANVKTDPAGTYREYLSDVRKQDNLSIKDLAEHLKQWQTIRDSVFWYLERDTLAQLHSVHIEDCKRTHDSIRMEFSRLALSKSRTYKDVLLVKEQVSLHLKDAELHRALYLAVQTLNPSSDFLFYYSDPRFADTGFPGVFRIVRNCAYSLFYERFGCLDVIFPCYFHQVLRRDILRFVIHSHTVAIDIIRCFRIDSKRVVIGRGSVPLSIIAHQETEIFVMVVHVSPQNVQYH